MNKPHTLRIAGITNDSVVDGPGLRFTVFTQGCRHMCKGCHNPQSHNENGGYVIYLYQILELIDKNPLLDGVTISGGEPFLQCDPLSFLLKEINKRQLSVMVYTGYTWEELTGALDKYGEVLKYTDILVDGPFIIEEKSYDLKYKGSKNQRVIDVKESLKQGLIVLWEG